LNRKTKTASFVPRSIFFLIGMLVISLGVTLLTSANLGTSPIICIPLVLANAFPQLTLGTYASLFNVACVIGEIFVLRKRYQLIQLTQLIAALLLGVFIDMWDAVLAFIGWGVPGNYFLSLIVLIVGAEIMALGIAIERRYEAIHIPCNGIVEAIVMVTHKDFGTIKIIFDIFCVLGALIISWVTMGKIVGVREGTVILVFLVGPFISLSCKLLTKVLGPMVIVRKKAEIHA